MKLWIAPAIIALTAAVAFADEDSGLRAWWRLKDDLRVAEARIAALETGLRDTRSEIERLRSDPFTIEAAIRQDLGFARPGETLLLLGD